MTDLVWSDDGAPRSRRFDDGYFAKGDGLAESRAVYLQGTGLPQAWQGRTRFVVAELGFGTGLNILALLQLWSRTRPLGATLHIFSVEAYPIAPSDAVRALAAWPELADLARPLLALWPQVAGVQRVAWPDLGATLDVAVADVAQALAGWDGRADAWFLDGFSPQRNPEMWSDAVLAAVAARSTPGARAATFTVAGAVRRGLQAQGFTVTKRPGHGDKRERLEAYLPGAPGPGLATGRVLVIGGGVAAAAIVRACRALGVVPHVLSDTPRGASGNPAALVTPRLDLSDTPATRLAAQAFVRAIELYAEVADAVLARGVRRLGDDPGRFARLAASPLYRPGALALEGDDALILTDALVIDPRRVVDAWLAGAPRIGGRADRLEPGDQGWRVLGRDGELLVEADVVVLAAGWGVSALRPTLTLQPVRGQVSLAAGVEAPAALWGPYVAPTVDGLLFGATHDRGDADDANREADHARNLAALRTRRPALAARLEGLPLAGRASIRAATPDHLPLAGGLAPGLHVLGGLGSRGMATAPLLAEHIAARIVGVPSPLPLALSATVEPGRFTVRAARRGSQSLRDPLT